MAVPVGSAVNAYKAAIERLKDVAPTETSGAGSSFSQLVKNLAEAAIETGKVSEQQTAAAAAGKADLNQVVLAVAEAELTLNTVVAVRDKVIEAYREISRMPL